MKFFAAAGAVFLASIVSANADSLICDNAQMYSKNFDSFFGRLPGLTVSIEYKGGDAEISKYRDGKLFESFKFKAEQITELEHDKDAVFFENSTARFAYVKDISRLAFVNAASNQVVMQCH